MTTLREIRRKLRSVQNIKKITLAMEMVAASRLRKAQEKAEQARPYTHKLAIILDQLASTFQKFSHPLLEKPRSPHKICYIIIAADKGLCGSHNQAIFKQAEKLLAQSNPENVELILFGAKAIDYFSAKNWDIRETFTSWGGKIGLEEIEELTFGLIQEFLIQPFEAWLIYTDYVNLAVREVRVEKLLNIESSEHKAAVSTDYLLEPNINEIFEEILPLYCLTRIQTALNESYASELAARIFSMRAATKNAEEMIEKLTLRRNKIRQATITRELIEITAGVESLK